MLERFQFYFGHSLNDLRVNGQRTLFAILAIAAGVAAIVSLQTLAVLIEDTLTGNVQQQNRADLQVQPPFFILSEEEIEEQEAEAEQDGGGPPDGFFVDEETARQAVEDGLLIERESFFFGQSNTQAGFSVAGVQAIVDAINAEYDVQAEATYRIGLSDPTTTFLGTGVGSTVERVGSDARVSRLTPVVVDTDAYPYYDEVTTVDGRLLAEAIQSPTDILLSENAIDVLQAEVGDQVRLNGAAEDFTIAGIVRVEEEITGFFSNPFIGLFGFYYLDEGATEFFEETTPLIEQVFIRIDDPTLVQDVDDLVREQFSYVQTTSTEDILEQNELIADNLETLVTAMGLLSLLIGSIGIVNTMQVIVRRRTVEIAVLKTIGLQAGQVTVLFLTEAFIMGVIGSIVGIVLGWAGTFVLRELADTFTGQALGFRIALQPVINGLIVGTLVTTVFGFLPTLSAGQVRPGVVLRPSDEIIPRAGFLRSLFAIIIVIVAVSFIAQGLLGGNLALAFLVIGGAFFGAGILFLILMLLIWIIGRFVPSFGLVDLKISLRQMLTSRGRGAITLLALVVGVFALSLITMFSQTFTNILDIAVNENSVGNVLVQGLPGSQEDILTRLDDLQADGTINSYYVDRTYTVELVSVDTANGQALTVEDLQSRVAEASATGSEFGFTPFLDLNTLTALTPDQVDTEEPMIAGEPLPLETNDDGLPGIVLQGNEGVLASGLAIGDVLNFTFEVEGGLFSQASTEELAFEIIGIAEEPEVTISFSPQRVNQVLLSSFPEDLAPSNTTNFVDVSEDNIPALRQSLNEIPGAFVLELGLLVDLVNQLVEQFQAFPTLVAALGLIVGGVVIANSVALATIERRREIAVMKSIGLQRERVLGMLLLENAILGLVGGLFGVGIGLVGLVLITNAANIPQDALPIGTALALMALCIGVAVIAAMTTAWGASGEKPLNVLRYE